MMLVREAITRPGSPFAAKNAYSRPHTAPARPAAFIYRFSHWLGNFSYAGINSSASRRFGRPFDAGVDRRRRDVAAGRADLRGTGGFESGSWRTLLLHPGWIRPVASV